MRYLQRAFDLAQARGYLTDPEVVATQDRVPPWFQSLSTEDGRSAYESRNGIQIPHAMQEFYSCPSLACFFEALPDGEIFLRNYSLSDFYPLGDMNLPPLVTWSASQHLIFACEGHSGMVCAAQLGQDDPQVSWGWEGQPEAYFEEDQQAVTFSEWVFGTVDAHEQTLAHWETCYRIFKNEGPRSGWEWILHLPGMAERVRRRP